MCAFCHSLRSRFALYSPVICPSVSSRPWTAWSITAFSASSPIPSINDMLEVPGGDFWLATNGGGVVRFALSGSQRFESFSVSSDLTSNRVNFLYRAPDGVIWAGTDGGVFRMRLDTHGRPTFERVRLRLAGH